jgi:nitrogen regulatory protein P-II 1
MVQPFMLEKLVEALEGIEGFPGLMVTDVRGFGRRTETPETRAPLDFFIEKMRIEIVARDEMVKKIVDTIVRSAHTGNRGDGKVFVWRVEQALAFEPPRPARRLFEMSGENCGRRAGPMNDTVARWKQRARSLKKEANALYLAARDARGPWVRETLGCLRRRVRLQPP